MAQMRMGIQSCLAAAAIALVIFVNHAIGAAVTVQSKYSTWMASSIMSRNQGIMTGKGGSSELLQAGITQKAFSALTAQYPGDTETPGFRKYLQDSAASVVPFTLNATYNALSYPMDRLSNGNALLNLYSPADNKTASFRAAADALRRSIDLNRRNPEGGLWYFTYPQWSYLDGMYSLAPFYTQYAIATTPSLSDEKATSALDDMSYQLDLLWNRTRNDTTGLLVHGYDASKTASWADAVTGASPHVWGRSLGWYAMALVDTLELLPESSACEYRDRLLEKWRSLAAALVQAVDGSTRGWWQVMDEPGREGNYIESSGTAMFAYSLLKGSRLGFLSAAAAPTASLVGAQAHEYLTDAFVDRNTNGTLGYNGTVAVCSLNSTATYEVSDRWCEPTMI